MPADPATLAALELERQRLVENVYRVFAHYPFDPRMPGDPAFPGLTDNTQVSKPLRQLGHLDFKTYIWKAVTTWGYVHDFKHFVPRLLELSMLVGSSADDFRSSFFGKLSYSNWQSWPSEEITAILDVLLCQFRLLLSFHPSSAVSFFTDMIRDSFDAAPLLAIWDVTRGRDADLHLGDLVSEYIQPLIRYRMLGKAAPPPEPYLQPIAHWFARGDVAGRLEAAFFAEQDSWEADWLSQAHFLLSLWLRDCVDADTPS